MSVVGKLNEQFPVSFFLHGPDVRTNLEFEYGESVDGGLIEQLRCGLHDLGIDRPYQHLTSSMRISVEIEDNSPVFKLDDGRIFRFPGDKCVEAIMWSAYSLAAGNGWLPKTSDTSVKFAVYNAESQKIAASVLYDISNRLDNIPNTGKIIKKISQEYCGRFIKARPRFSDRAVTEEGMNLIADSRRPKIKQTKIELEDLADILYGRRSQFTEQIHNYCSFIRSTDAYKRAIENSSALCAEKLCELPIYRLSDSVEKARTDIIKDMKADINREEADQGLRGDFNGKKIDINSIRGHFSAAEDFYSRMSEIEVLECFVNDLTDRLKVMVGATSTVALEKLRDERVEIKDFCAITPADYGIKIRWTPSGEIEFNDAKVEKTAWDETSVGVIQKNVNIIPDGYFSRMWFAGETLADEINAAGVYRLEPVYSLDSQLLCALFFKENQTGVQNG